jgi:hypothetical protein
MKHMVTNWQTTAFGLVVPALYGLRFAGVPGLDFLPPFEQELPLILSVFGIGAAAKDANK